MDEFTTARTIARTFGLGLSTTYRLAADGVIPSVRIGRSVRFNVAEVARALSTERTRTTVDH